MSSLYTSGDPNLSPKGWTSLKAAQREAIVATLDHEVRDALNSKYGKPTVSVSFVSECRFRHIIPALVGTAFLSEQEMTVLELACPLVRLSHTLQRQYDGVDPDFARGYGSYANYSRETSVNMDRVNSTNVGLFRCWFSIPKLVGFLGGPHLGEHRNVAQTIHRLRPSVDPHVLQELHRILFVYSAPKSCQASATEENFLAYLWYGNHGSAANNPQELRKVFYKDVKRGFAIALDKRLIPFIPGLHVTPLGIVDIDNPWKQS
jgi:hypothetical protein